MNHVFHTPEAGDLRLYVRKGRFYLNLVDLARGMTLCDMNDTLERMRGKGLVYMTSKSGDLVPTLEISWLNYFTHLTRNPKANRFKTWLWKSMIKETDAMRKKLEQSGYPIAKENEPFDEIEEETEMEVAQQMTMDLQLPKVQAQTFKVADNPVQEFVNAELGKIRVVEKDGEPWFVASDVCRVLEIRNSRMATDRLDDDEKAAVSLTDTSSNGVVQRREMTIVNEPGLYTLISGSRKSEARVFRRWVTHEVLPSIRKHGIYATPQTVIKMMGDPMFTKGVLELLSEEQQKNIQLNQENNRLNTYISNNAERTALGKLVEASGQSISVGKFAKVIFGDDSQLGRNKMFRKLHEMGYLMKGKDNGDGGKYWEPKQVYMKQKLFEMTEYLVNNTGEVVPMILITPKGQAKISKKILEENQMAI